MSRPSPFLTLGAALAGCAAPSPHAVVGSGKLIHVVAFWLKPGAPADLVTRMRDFYVTRVAREVAGVENVWVGRPQPSDRSVVDASFSCMSIVRFAGAAAEVGWQTHPVHDELKKLFEAHLERVVVYDFVE